MIVMIKVRLREMLWEKEMTAAEVSRRTGLNKANLSNIMRNKNQNVGLQTINTLCNCLGCDFHELVVYIPD